MANVARKVTVIKPSNSLFAQHSLAERKQKLRVAAYARVSTDFDEQQTSFDAQVDYYTKHIQSNPHWEFVDIYTDEGISGTSIKNREGFQQMIHDAMTGKIDRILTKSVSRFARNTVDTLTYVRQLKEKGVEVYFEKENIYTMDSKGELLITIMSSLAQEESRSLSENVTWGQRKRFADGKVSLPYKQFLGYKRGADGLPEIVPEEAEKVRLIYRLFIQGLTPNAIAKKLTESGVPTPGSKKNWQSRVVESILTNEKYKGAALLQKSFTVDFLTKKMKINEGEVAQYYVENSHEAIIDPLEFDLVQVEMARRKEVGRKYSGNQAFSSRIICGDCGAYYGAKVWHSNDKYRHVVWQCNSKFRHNTRCKTSYLDEEEIQTSFLKAFSILMADKKKLLSDCRMVKKALADCVQLKADLQEKEEEMEVVAELTRRCVDENSSTAMDQDEYKQRYDGLVSRYQALQAGYNAFKTERTKRTERDLLISGFMFAVIELDELPLDFDEALWTAVIDHVTIHNDGRMVFSFRNGSDIEA